MRASGLLVALALLGGCAKESASSGSEEYEEVVNGQRVVRREGEPGVAILQKGDPELKAATRKARSTLDDFINRLKIPGNAEFFVKAGFPMTTGGTETIWIYGVRLENGKFRGEVDNEPLRVPSLKLGQSVLVDPKDVVDWMIQHPDGRQEGGFTSEVLLRRTGGKP